jgi:hypothetical protein
MESEQYFVCVSRSLSHDPDFWLQQNTKLLLYPRLYLADQCLNITGTCMATVDNEIGVLKGNLGVTPAQSFKASLINQTGCVIANRVAKY